MSFCVILQEWTRVRGPLEPGCLISSKGTMAPWLHPTQSATVPLLILPHPSLKDQANMIGTINLCIRISPTRAHAGYTKASGTTQRMTPDANLKIYFKYFILITRVVH